MRRLNEASPEPAICAAPRRGTAAYLLQAMHWLRTQRCIQAPNSIAFHAGAISVTTIFAQKETARHTPGGCRDCAVRNRCVHGALLVGKANLPQTAWDMSQGLRQGPAGFSNCLFWPDPVDRNHHGRRQHRGRSPRSHWVCTPRSHPAMPPPKSIRAVFS